MALSAELNVTIHQIDVATAYFNGEKAVEIYIEKLYLLEEMLDVRHFIKGNCI